MDAVLSPSEHEAQATAPGAVKKAGASKRRLAVAALAITVVGAGLGVWRLRVMAAGATTYGEAQLTRGPVSRAITASGTVNPVLTILVGSYVSGVIRTISCDYNTRVVRGQICAQIDPRPYQVIVDQTTAALGEARAQLAKDQASLRYDEVNLTRLTTLLKEDSTSRDAVDVARSLHDQAQAQVALDQATIQEKQANLEAAKVNLGYTRIVSPVDGTVVSRNVTQGQTVAASFETPTLFLIATDLTKMEVDANVSESDIGGAGASLAEGAQASFTVDAYPGRVFHGVVSQIRQAPQSVQNVVTYDVLVSVDNAALLLKPGMTATVKIVTASRGAVLRAPNAALRFQPGGVKGHGPAAQGKRGLYVLRDGRPAAVAVTTGLSDDAYTEIVSGDIRAGDTVIVSEQQGVRSKPSTPAPGLRL